MNTTPISDKRVWYFEAFNFLMLGMSLLFLFGYIKSQPTYFITANTFIRSFLAGWLVYRFRFSKEKAVSKFDRHACYVAGVYILLSTFADSLQSFKLILENKIKSTFIK